MAEFAQQYQSIISGFYVLLAVLAFPSLIAILNTLAIGVIERTREIGMLRAIGATRGQVRKTVVAEALLLAALGTAFGILAGLYLSYVFVEGLNAAGYMKMAYTFPAAGVLAAMRWGCCSACSPRSCPRARRRGWRLSRRCSTSDRGRRLTGSVKRTLAQVRAGLFRLGRSYSAGPITLTFTPRFATRPGPAAASARPAARGRCVSGCSGSRADSGRGCWPRRRSRSGHPLRTSTAPPPARPAAAGRRRGSGCGGR